MEFEILSLFPEYFDSPFSTSMLKRAQERELISIKLTNIRDFAQGRHKQVDDRPFGGGPGMVLMPEPVTQALRACRREHSHVVYLSPQGKRLTAAKARALAAVDHLVLLCGHYEGIDERVLDEVDEEISIGDFVLTSGMPAAVVVVDAVARFVPDVLGHEEAAAQDSFEEGLLDCPHYTRPSEFEGKRVPEVLIQGNHAKIEAWRREKRIEKTSQVRAEYEDDFSCRRTGEKIGDSGRTSFALGTEV